MTKVLGLVIFVILLPFTSTAYAEDLQLFSSDGCSAFPDGSVSQNELWLECCTAHDFAYWQGGSYSERMNTDLELHECVSKVGEEEIALLMLAGVRVGGSPFFPTAFRWGYGWSYPKFYGELTDQELQQVKNRINQLKPQDTTESIH
jgi:hypothetical protein